MSDNPTADALGVDGLLAAQQILGYTFNDPSLLELAFTHSSRADDKFSSNERLEFLGDSVLALVVCDHLFRTYDNLLEGDLTKIKSMVVSRDSCARVAKRLELDHLIVLGKGMRNRGELPSSLAAGCFEAVIGALYLDAGHEFTSQFILKHMKSKIERAVGSGHQQNFKSVLQQIAQQQFGQSPTYIVLDEKGPDHAKCFEICVEIGVRRFSSSWGPAKKVSEQKAALNALQELGFAHVNGEGEVIVTESTEAESPAPTG